MPFQLRRAEDERPPGRFDPAAVGWMLGRSERPRGVQLWVPFDWSTCVYGIPGTGKTQRVLARALLAAPGAALFASTKTTDITLTIARREQHGPVYVLDPLGQLPGLPQLVWDPVAGCVDSMVAARRGKAFAHGTLSEDGSGAAKFYTSEAGKVLAAFFHAAALSGRSLAHVVDWVADPSESEAETILLAHPQAARGWGRELGRTLQGDARTVSNTIVTVQQAMEVFRHSATVARCVPGPGRPATDLADVIRAGGTIYLLGKDDALSPTSALLTAVTEDIFDTVERLAAESEHGRLTPPFVAAVDELPSIAPIPSLPQRLADGRGRGLCIVWGAQAHAQVVKRYGQDQARVMLTITNALLVLGGSKDQEFNEAMARLIGETQAVRRSASSPGMFGSGSASTSTSMEWQQTMRANEIRELREGRAVLLGQLAPAMVVRLPMAVDGRDGQLLQDAQRATSERVAAARLGGPDPAAAAAAAQAWARANGHGPAPW
jgi:type IV secretion system protein VirD4